jgi:hypothetical protein
MKIPWPLLSLFATHFAAAVLFQDVLAAPRITALTPAAAAPGRQIEIAGSGFADATDVIFVDTRTGERFPSLIHTIADDRLRVVVPQHAAGRKGYVIVRTAHGVGVGFPDDVRIHNASTHLKGGGGDLYIILGRINVSNSGSGIFLGENATTGNFANISDTTIFLSAGSAASGSAGNRNWIYRAPGSTVTWEQPGPQSRIIDVDKIHLSQLPTVFEWMGPQGAEQLTTAIEGAGRILRDPDLPDYYTGETVLLRALPDPGHGFVRWSGDAAPGIHPLHVVMHGAKQVTAHFAPEVSLQVDAPAEWVRLQPNVSAFGKGAHVTLVPNPPAGWAFAGWEGDRSGFDQPLHLTLEQNTTLRALFVPGPAAWGRMSWGDDRHARLPLPGDLHDLVAIDTGGFHSVGLREDGTVLTWGNDSPPPAGLARVTAIAAGGGHSLALRDDGRVFAWGANAWGQAVVPEILDTRTVVAVAAGWGISLALTVEGQVVAWGRRDYGEINVPASLNDVVDIAAGDGFALALRADGTVVGWGTQIPAPPAGLRNVTAIGAGTSHALALTDQGTVVAWGSPHSHFATPPEGLTNVVAIAAGLRHSVALKADGEIVQWGDLSGVFDPPPQGLDGVAMIRSNRDFNVVLRRPEQPPEVGLMPRTLTTAGDKVLLRAHAHGEGNLEYRWFHQGRRIPGADQPFLLIENPTPEDWGFYRVAAKNQHGWGASGRGLVFSHGKIQLFVDGYGGRVEAEPNLPSYDPGAVVTLTAIPDEGFEFVRWERGVRSLDNPVTVTLEQHLTVDAVFVDLSRSPPIVTEITPPQVASGELFQIRGTSLSGVTAVHFYSTVWPQLHQRLEHSILSDQELQVQQVDLPSPLVLEAFVGILGVENRDGLRVALPPQELIDTQKHPPVHILEAGSHSTARLFGLVYLKNGSSFSGRIDSGGLLIMEKGSSFTGTVGAGTRVLRSSYSHFAPSTEFTGSLEVFPLIALAPREAAAPELIVREAE